MIVRFTRRAATELDQVLSYIDRASPAGAARVKARIKDCIDLLASYPKAGQRLSSGSLRRLVVKPYPYLVFYREHEDAVVIHGVRHAARDPDDLPPS